MLVFSQCLLLPLTSPTGSSLESVIYIYHLMEVLLSTYMKTLARRPCHGAFASSDVLHLPNQGIRTSKVWRCWIRGILLRGKKLALRKVELLFLASATIGNNFKTSFKPWTCCIYFEDWLYLRYKTSSCSFSSVPWVQRKTWQSLQVPLLES